MPKTFYTCPECGLRFERKHHRAQFCTPAHSKAYNNRQLAEGQRIIGLAKAWRAGRDFSRSKLPANVALAQSAKDAFGQLCRELDALVSADKEAGRLHPTKVYRRRSLAGLLDR